MESWLNKSFNVLMFVGALVLLIPMRVHGAELEDLESQFNHIAKTLYPSVVSITTIKLEKLAGGGYAVANRNLLFDDFIEELFGFGRVGTVSGSREATQRRVDIGSGIIVDPAGYILTNFHLVEKAQKGVVSLRLSNGREYEGHLLGADPLYDLALVKIPAKGLTAAALADSDQVKVGNWAVAIGNPYGFIFEDAEPTMTVGVISALNRSLPSLPGQNRTYRHLIQTDAAVNLGNSGGPLVNLNGEVVGINVAIVSTTGGNQGIGFAIPSNQCHDLLSHFIRGQQVQHSWIGIEAQNMRDDLASFFGIPNRGVVVTRAISGAPAAQAGIRDGDILVRYGGRDIDDTASLLDQINQTRSGESLVLEFYRNGQPREATVLVGARPAFEVDYEKLDQYYWRGLRPEAINELLRTRYELSRPYGIVIVDIQTEGLAEQARLQEGDIILKVGERAVNTIEDFYEAVKNQEGDVLIKTQRGFFVIRA